MTLAGHDDAVDRIERSLTIDPGDLQIERGAQYDRITMRNSALDELPEHHYQPQLPVMVKWLLLPDYMTVSNVAITIIRRTKVDGHFRPYPILAESDSLEAPPDNPPWDAIVYPTATGVLAQAGQSRRYRMAKILLWPLEYDAATEEISVITEVQITLALRTLTDQEIANSLHFLRPGTADDPFRHGRRWIADHVLNPESLVEWYPIYDELPQPPVDDPLPGKRTPLGPYVTEHPSGEGQPVHYLIITNNVDEAGRDLGSGTAGSMEEVFQRYAEQLTNEAGIITEVRTVPCQPEWDRIKG